tara:strand:+ start:1109 stop:2401 length:1293 start_codon:yes stop_codon:yes gene_type:complete
MPNIENILAREILDSRGNPTVECDVILSDGSVGTAGVPSGASTGKFEAVELRDGDKKRYGGKGVLKALSNITDIILPEIKGMDSRCQKSIDNKMIDLDGTKNKDNLGANATLAVSLAVAKASSRSQNIPLHTHISDCKELTLPVPMMNVVNGGKHAHNSTDIQEFMIVPAGFSDFSSAIRAGAEVYQTLLNLLRAKGLNTTVGDEGGFAPALDTNENAIELILEAIERAGYNPGVEFFIAIDAAASELYNIQSSKYDLQRENRQINANEFINIYESWIKKYPIISIEDGLSEDEWEDWHTMHKKIGKSVQLVGDDLLTTNTDRIEKGINGNNANSVLIKPNQIGTLTETLKAIVMAQSAGWGVVVSHRSGETEDSTISDICVATNAGQIKAGAPARGERTAKYNRLLRIEKKFSGKSTYAGISPYSNFIH